MSTRFYVTLGWWGYFTCAVIYVISGLRSGDLLTLIGSAFFLAATVAFLIPHYLHRWDGRGKESDQ